MKKNTSFAVDTPFMNSQLHHQPLQVMTRELALSGHAHKYQKHRAF